MIEEQLQAVIEQDLDELKGIAVGSEEYKVAVDGLTKLIDRAIEMDKIQIECEEKSETRKIEDRNRKAEEQMKLQQMKEDRIDRHIKNGLTAFSIISGIGVTVWGALKSWKFEETGTVTTTAGRKFIGNLFSTKK